MDDEYEKIIKDLNKFIIRKLHFDCSTHEEKIVCCIDSVKAIKYLKENYNFYFKS